MVLGAKNGAKLGPNCFQTSVTKQSKTSKAQAKVQCSINAIFTAKGQTAKLSAEGQLPGAKGKNVVKRELQLHGIKNEIVRK